jgi:hypothetical protein
MIPHPAHASPDASEVTPCITSEWTMLCYTVFELRGGGALVRKGGPDTQGTDRRSVTGTDGHRIAHAHIIAFDMVAAAHLLRHLAGAQQYLAFYTIAPSNKYDHSWSHTYLVTLRIQV